jgi:hypothetical protein
MRTHRAALVALAIALFPGVSRAQAILGVRVGYAPAFGDIEKDAEMDVRGQIPVQVDALIKLSPTVAVGAYGSYGLALLKSSFCEEGISCSARDIRAGVQAMFMAPKVGSNLVLWSALGFGYEWTTETQKAFGESVEEKFRGFELFNFQTGADYAFGRNLLMGPYLMLSVAQYTHASVKVSFDPTLDQSGKLEEKSGHVWFGFGFRARFDI